MNLQKIKTPLFVVIAVLTLLIASPALQRLLTVPQSDFFTEMRLLGPEHGAYNYPPLNVTSGSIHKVFLSVGNHLGSLSYYSIQVKFRNQTQPAANSTTRTPSSLPSLYNIPVFVADKETWEIPITFSFTYSSGQDPVNATLSRVNFDNVIVNGAVLNLNGNSANWDPQKKWFFGNLFFELWIYNSEVGSFQYHKLYTDLKFNMTA